MHRPTTAILALLAAGSAMAGADTVEEVIAERPGVELPMAGGGAKTDLGAPTVVTATEHAGEVIVTPGETLRLPVSASNPNRLVTPFSKAYFATNANVQWQERRGTIYLTAATPEGIAIDEPIAGFIYGPDDAPAIAVVLEPQRIPLAEYTFRIPAWHGANDSAAGGDAARQGRPYVDKVVEQLTAVVRDGEVAGFSRTAVEARDIHYHGAVRASISERHQGGARVIERIALLNEGSEPVTLSEAQFYAPGVLAVALHPRVNLAPYESTELFIVRTGR